MSRTPLTPDEQTAVNALQNVTYPPVSWDKRFARSLSGVTGLTDKERPQVWRLFIRYRRQIKCENKDMLLHFAMAHSAPDFRKRDAVAAALAKIETIKAHNWMCDNKGL